jgi:hypothetical protein
MVEVCQGKKTFLVTIRRLNGEKVSEKPASGLGKRSTVLDYSI